MKQPQAQPGDLAGNALNHKPTEDTIKSLRKRAKAHWAEKKVKPVTLDWSKPCKK